MLKIPIVSLFPIHMNYAQRVPGEWEPQQGVVFTWIANDHVDGYANEEVHLEIVGHLVDYDNNIWINYRSRQQKEEIVELLKMRNVPMEKIRWIKFDVTGASYPRDFGPEWIYNQGKLNSIDMNWSYYGYISQEFALSKMLNKNMESYDRKLSRRLGIKVYNRSKLFSEGGGKEFNGAGVLMVVEQTELSRNPGWTKEELEAEYKKLFHLERIIWLPKPTFEDENMFSGYIPGPDGKENALRAASANGHIDEFCRFVGPKKILLAEVSEEQAQSHPIHQINHKRLETAYQVLSEETDSEGNPFEIIRIPVPELEYVAASKTDEVYKYYLNAEFFTKQKSLLDGSPLPAAEKMLFLPASSYCNFLIANGVVLGQKYWKPGKSESIKELDEKAKEVLQSLFPDREVVMIDVLAINLGGGGIHCNTKQIPASTSSY